MHIMYTRVYIYIERERERERGVSALCKGYWILQLGKNSDLTSVP